MLGKRFFKKVWALKTIQKMYSEQKRTKMEYKLIPEDRHEEVISHLKEHFFGDEPLNRASGFQRGAGNPDLEYQCLATLEDHMSIMAVDANNKITGVILNGTLHPGDTESSQKKLALTNDEKFKKVFQLLYVANLKDNIFEHFDVDKAFDVRMLSVDTSHRGQGIAKGLVKYSEDIAKEHEFKLMKADATGLFSQKILKSNGFEVLSEQYYDKYVDEFGRMILPVESPHLKLQVLYKLFK